MENTPSASQLLGTKAATRIPAMVCDLGFVTSYEKVWNLQKLLVEKRVENSIPDTLLLVEHDHVLTSGRSAHAENILLKELPHFEIERGGDVTYHGPGQLVVYPIISLQQRSLGVRSYIERLEAVIIDALEKLGVRNCTGKLGPLTGVWVANVRKIASIGVAANHWVTYHGFALNVNTDLSYFQKIKPCGFESGIMTSVAKELNAERVLMNEVKKRIWDLFLKSSDTLSPNLIFPFCEKIPQKLKLATKGVYFYHFAVVEILGRILRLQNETGAPRPSSLVIFFRLTRIQFLPLIILPASVGTALAYRLNHSFNLIYFALVLAGVILLHLGANAIDDCYDYQNGVDRIANDLFPKDFGGWKPLPRRMISLGNAKNISYILFGLSLVLAIYFFFVVGIWSLIFGISGILLAFFYTAPPLKLDYQGYGLGELSILLAFGPIPVLGAFYVQTGHLSFLAFLVSLAVGLMTVTILIDHDLIFYEVYAKARKYSLGTVLGRVNALKTSLLFTLVTYAVVFGLVASRELPVTCVAAPILSALILSLKRATFRKGAEPPPFYLPFTVNALLSDWIFSLVLAISIALPFY